MDKQLANCFKALGDETRLKVVEMLKGGTMCGCKILEKFQITQPTLSYHMKALVDCGLVTAKKEGVWNHYSLNVELMSELSNCLMVYEKTCCNRLRKAYIEKNNRK
ncbi:MAG: metalloregulator ArsR/SmtB family transcription factor [Clostridia bacterium]|nr:metalloregulator ArsR/SmtB family transcription factor [Clostridia bacterium]